jgi:hypothetical protein
MPFTSRSSPAKKTREKNAIEDGKAFLFPPFHRNAAGRLHFCNILLVNYSRMGLSCHITFSKSQFIAADSGMYLFHLAVGCESGVGGGGKKSQSLLTIKMRFKRH